MKQKFTTKWKSSSQPRKQRKYRVNAPIHILHKFVSVHLSKDLIKKYAKRNIPIRKGDKVKILRGEFKRKTGKVDIVDLKKTRISIEKINKTKKDGSNIVVWFHPSNLKIQELNLEDKKRFKKMNDKNKPKENKNASQKK